MYTIENHLAELKIRFKSISKKFDLDLENLSDYQILDIQQNKSTDSEFNEIVVKVTELSSLAPVSSTKTVELIERVNKTRDRLAQKRDNFYDTLRNIVLKRDITPEKMKRASEGDYAKFRKYFRLRFASFS